MMLHFDAFLNMTKKRIFFFITFCTLTVLWAGVIFDFSAAGGEKSVEQSSTIIETFFGIVQGGSAKKEEAYVVQPAAEDASEVSSQTSVKFDETEKKPQSKPQQPVQSAVVKDKDNKQDNKQDKKKETQQKNKNFVLKENTSQLTEAEEQREQRIKEATEQNSKIPMFTTINTVVRKIAHICSYVLLAFLMYFAVGSVSAFPRNNTSVPWISASLCVLFACTDEYHQSFVLGRTGRISDVIVDSFGVFVGTLVAFWIARGLISIIMKEKSLPNNNR